MRTRKENESFLRLCRAQNSLFPAVNSSNRQSAEIQRVLETHMFAVLFKLKLCLHDIVVHVVEILEIYISQVRACRLERIRNTTAVNGPGRVVRK